MADSLDGLGSGELFTLIPNWVNKPNTNIIVSRYFQAYPGSSFAMQELTSDVPQEVQLGFLLEKEEEFNLLDFFNERKGRLQRFWVRDPKQSFVLKETATLGSSVLKCYPNSAEDVMRGDERIWIEMVDGDLLTREVTSIDYYTPDDEVHISLNTVVDRDITPTNHLVIAKLLLARFAYDTIEVRLESNVVGQTDLKFRELVKEYTDV